MLLARVDVALRIGRDAANGEKLTRIAAAAADGADLGQACLAGRCALSCSCRRRRTAYRCCASFENATSHADPFDETTPNWPVDGSAERVLRHDPFLHERCRSSGTPESGCCSDRRRRRCRRARSRRRSRREMIWPVDRSLRTLRAPDRRPSRRRRTSAACTRPCPRRTRRCGGCPCRPRTPRSRPAS